jgi:hypothetical protein
VSTSTAMPTTATGSPTPVISKTPRGSPPWATSRSETTRLVDVPITVITPPNTAAYDSGIRYGEADTPERRHHVTTRGAASATSGVFGRIADSAPLVTASRPSRARLARAGGRRQPVRLGEPSSTRSISGDSAPVTVAAPARTYSAAIVIGADDDSPDSASPWSTTFGEQQHADGGTHRRGGRQPIEREDAERGDQHHQRDPGVGRHGASLLGRAIGCRTIRARVRSSRCPPAGAGSSP